MRDALVLPADVTTPQGRAAIVQVVTETGVEILINNAGMVPSGAVETTEDAQIAATLALNLAAPIALTRDLPGARTASGGRSSISARSSGISGLRISGFIRYLGV